MKHNALATLLRIAVIVVFTCLVIAICAGSIWLVKEFLELLFMR